MTALHGATESAPVVSLLRRKLIGAVDDALDLTVDQEWVWGERDCALWAANVLHGPLGYDPAESFRKRYTTPRGYLRVLRRDGHASLLDALRAVSRLRKWKAIVAEDASKGDLGFVAIPGNAAGGCCVLNYTPTHWVGFRNLGHVYVPADKVVEAWKLA